MTTETIEIPAAELEQIHNEIAELRNEVKDLRDELQSYRACNERDKAEIRQKVTDVEAEASDDNGGTETDEPNETVSVEPETPLENVVSLPEHVAEAQLSANQSRARFVAKDITDYATSVPAGYALSAADLRKVLSARDGGGAHSQTVARVMNFLDRLGDNGVDVVKRRGMKRVIFDERAVDRLQELGGMQTSSTDKDHGVVSS